MFREKGGVLMLLNTAPHLGAKAQYMILVALRQLKIIEPYFLEQNRMADADLLGY
jgi:hypothetical protein